MRSTHLFHVALESLVKGFEVFSLLVGAGVGGVEVLDHLLGDGGEHPAPVGAPVLVDVGAGKGAVVVVGVFPGLVVDAPLLRVGEDGVDAGEELGAGRRS